MHTLIITPHLLHSSLLASALERQNIKSLAVSPTSLPKDWCPTTDAVLFPHSFEKKDWELLLPFLLNVSPKMPLIFLNKLDPFLFKEKRFKTLTRQCVEVDETLSIDELPLLVKDIIHKRPGYEPQKQVNLGDFVLDRAQRTVIRQGQKNILTKKEFFLLELLSRNAGQVISRDLIMDYLWDKNTFVESNSVDAAISRLRKKMNLRRNDPLLRTIPTLGYQLCVESV